jgi:hypothetical protein
MQIKTFIYELGPFNTYFLKGGWSAKTMDDHIAKMVNDGWEPMNSANDSGHVKLGKTVGLMAMTGGLSLLFGASRTPSTITMTFKKA